MSGPGEDSGSDGGWLLAPEARVDHFLVLQRLGRGGMAEVYLAKDTTLGRKVALKLIRPEMLGDESAVERFIFEAKATACFNHPNIVTIHAVGAWQGKPYIALEYLEGETLRARADRRDQSIAEIINIARAIAEALAEAHGSNLIHRDLKPENIMLGRDGRLRVVDFGLARVISREAMTTELYQTATMPAEEVSLVLSAIESTAGSIRGTPLYMAPEQWRNEVSSGATDIWAVGVILYDLLTGSLPYVGGSALEIAARVCSEQPAPSPRTRAGQAPAALVALVDQCLRKDAAQRPTAAQLVTELRRIEREVERRAHEPTLAPAPVPPPAVPDADTIVDPAPPVAAAADTVADPSSPRLVDPLSPAAASRVSLTLVTPTRLGLRTVLRVRSAPLYVLAVLVTTTVFGASAREALLLWNMPETGLFMRTDGALVRVDERWPALPADARVLAVNGQPVATRFGFLQALARAPHGVVRVVIASGGRQRELSANTTRRGWLEAALLAIRVLLGGACFFVGALAFFVRPGTKVSWLFFLFCTGVSVVCLAPIGMMRTPAWLTVTLVGIGLSAAVAPHLFVEFPSPLQISFRIPHLRSVLVVLPYGLSLLVLGGCIAKVLFGWGLHYGRAAALLIATTAVLTIALLVGQYLHARRIDDPLSLARCRVLVAAVVAGLFVPALVNAIRLLLNVGSSPLPAHLNALPIAFFVGLTGFAIVRHNVLEVDRFTAAVVGYGVTLAAVGTLFGAVLLGLVVVAGQTAALSTPVASVVLGAAAALGFMPLYRYLKRWVDRWFYRGTAGAKRAAEGLRELSHAIHVADRPQSLRAALLVGSALLVERVEVWLLSGDGTQLFRESAEGRPVGPAEISIAGPVGAALGQATHPIGLEGITGRPAAAEAQAELWDHELALAVPIKTFGSLAGFVGAGRKLSGLAFTEEEEASLDAIAGQLTLLLERESSGSQKLGQYRIERRVGVGGMAEVFLAWQLGPRGFERKVALKRMLPAFCEDPNAVTMFLDEARIAAQLTHKNIVQIYEVGGGGNAFFIAMEYVDGPSVREILHRAREGQRQVPVAIALAICDGVLAALDHAHGQVDRHGEPLSLVHRDVTPANIHVTREGEVKLLDFGIARAASQVHVTRTGTTKGTVPYMSLEQASGRPVDHRADLYSLGAVLYELLSGNKAFPGGPTARRPPPLVECRDDVPEGVSALVVRALAYEAEQRFDDAAAMRRELAELLAGVGPTDARSLAAWLGEVCPTKVAR